MGKNNFIFIYMDPPKSREERRREKEAARQRKQRKKEIQDENYRIKEQYLTCKEILWLQKHENSKKISPRKLEVMIGQFLFVLAIVIICVEFAVYAITDEAVSRLGTRIFAFALFLGLCSLFFWGFSSPIHKNAKKIIAEGRAQEYIEDYVSKYGEIK